MSKENNKKHVKIVSTFYIMTINFVGIVVKNDNENMIIIWFFLNYENVYKYNQRLPLNILWNSLIY